MMPLLYLRALLLYLIVPLITFVFSVACVFVIIPFTNRRAMDVTIHLWARCLCGLSGVKIHVEGKENLRGLKSALFLSNHQSHFDIPVLFLAIPQSFRMVAKRELFQIPLFGQVLAKAGFVALDRQNVEMSQEALVKMKGHFDKGESFWMAPEGTRFKGNGLGPFKSGAFYLAAKTGITIVPVCVFGTHWVLPKGAVLINTKQWSQDVYVKILPPYIPTEKSRAELKNVVRDQLVQAYHSNQKDSKTPQNPQT